MNVEEINNETEAPTKVPFTKTIKLRLYPDSDQARSLEEMCEEYRKVCNYVSEYIFNNDFELRPLKLNKLLYYDLRSKYNLGSQMTQSVFRTVVARYKTLESQLAQKPYKYKDENGKWQFEKRTLHWIEKPIYFARIQADLVHGSNYSFLNNGTIISLTTLNKRTKMSFAKRHFGSYLNNVWTLGTGKLVRLKKIWYLHIPVTKNIDVFTKENVSHVVGIDRGLRFLATIYDDHKKTTFISGKQIAYKRHRFLETRRQIQSKNTRAAKRVLKRLSGRENRWMSDINHRISKTLVQTYGPNTLFVLEDLTGVSFDNLNKSKELNNNIRSWAFYQLEQFLIYKAHENQSEVIKVNAQYTSQRCPKCGITNKDNRHHDTHEYVCSCGYHSNDDRIGAMNIQLLGTKWISGEKNPVFKK